MTRYRELEENDPLFIEQYKLWIDESKEELVTKLNELKKLIEDKTLNEHWSFDSIEALGFHQHLYRPLLHIQGKAIQVSPVELNKGERDFVEDLRSFYNGNQQFFEGRELYLLRNLSRGRGLGFFEAGNFHPDFILWIVEGDTQRITFIDPKGMRQLGINHPKVMFFKAVQELGESLGDPNVRLNSFILSVTPFQAVQWQGSKPEFEERNVLFQHDDKQTYIRMMLTRILESA
jgi:hypothetical protein